MKPKRVVAWGVGVLVVVAVGLYGEFVRETTNFSPTLLLGCADVEWPLAAWTCKQVLLHRDFSPGEVAELNREGAAAFPVSSKNPAFADEMLSLFIARGVDVNAVDEQSKAGWTALHMTVSSGNVAGVKLLLRHGARPDIKNRIGVTPLDYARQWQQKFPADQNHAEVVRLLEEAEKQQSAQK
jgi:hypothetical protein